MEYLVATETVLLIAMVVLVGGVLRSHGEVLTRLRSLDDEAARNGNGIARTPQDLSQTVQAATLPLIRGLSIELEPIEVRVDPDRDLLVAFLTTGCLSCQSFWEALRERDPESLPADVDLAVVTKDREEVSLAELRRLAAGGDLPVVMCSEAWQVLEVPGSPYFAFLERGTGRLLGAGSAHAWEQVVSLVRDEIEEIKIASTTARTRASRVEQEDAALQNAGIGPDHPSFYQGAFGEAVSGADAH